MPKNSPIPVPRGNLVAWTIASPDAAAQAIESLNLLLALQIKLIPAGLFSLNQQQSLLASEQNIIANLPLLWPAGVPADLAGGATLAEVIAMVNRILAGERAVQELPGAP